MNQNTVGNPKTEVPKTKEMNDENYLNSLLECLKNITNNYSIALNEMSNETLYQQLFPLFQEAQDMQRETFELAFKKGWYTLEKAEATKITKAINQMEGQLNEVVE